VLEPLMRGSGLRGLFGSQIGVRHRPDHLDVVPRADDIQHFRCAVPAASAAASSSKNQHGGWRKEIELLAAHCGNHLEAVRRVSGHVHESAARAELFAVPDIHEVLAL
jgi:hypothetical protein